MRYYLATLLATVMAGVGCAHSGGPEADVSYGAQLEITFGALPPAPDDRTVVLFDGASWEGWMQRDGSPSRWQVQDDGSVLVAGGDAITTRQFGDFQLHIEFLCPVMPLKAGQARANSGVYLHGRYEVQVLDSYGLPVAGNGCGAIYSIAAPIVNASKPPGEWQTYDIVFETPRWDGDGKLEKPAYITVFQNGIVLHHRQEILGPTGHKSAANYDTPHPAEGPLKLQDHGNPLRFRNIWIRPLRDYDTAGASGVL